MNFSSAKHTFKENNEPDSIRYLVNVTIESAKGFEGCSNVYVRYWLDIPEGTPTIFRYLSFIQRF